MLQKINPPLSLQGGGGGGYHTFIGSGPAKVKIVAVLLSNPLRRHTQEPGLKLVDVSLFLRQQQALEGVIDRVWSCADMNCSL